MASAHGFCCHLFGSLGANVGKMRGVLEKVSAQSPLTQLRRLLPPQPLTSSKWGLLNVAKPPDSSTHRAKRAKAPGSKRHCSPPWWAKNRGQPQETWKPKTIANHAELQFGQVWVKTQNPVPSNQPSKSIYGSGSNTVPPMNPKKPLKRW